MNSFASILFVLATSVLALPVRGNRIQKFITGGDPARPAQFPFQVGVQTRKVSQEGYEYNAWCGGSLISDEWVLTAAHCLYGGISGEIYLGATDLSRDEPGRIVINVPKENLYVYENYIPQQIRNDIALVKLPQRVQLNEYIQIVNLPRRSQMAESFIKQIGWISGWGKLGDEKGSTEQLQYTRRWILPHEYCDYSYGGFYAPLVQVCVDGSHGISACNGDSGGPLTIEEDDGTRTLVGATSYGQVYCEKGLPSVYTRVTAFLDWIIEKTGIKLRD
uniref:Venom polypeptide n=1 Tax=Dolopus genitalis TaxID=2488630 RepID=A0A3G5BIF7_DOLGE|nr:venom polypeptide [Dolopus genitalis]